MKFDEEVAINFLMFHSMNVYFLLFMVDRDLRFLKEREKKQDLFIMMKSEWDKMSHFIEKDLRWVVKTLLMTTTDFSTNSSIHKFSLWTSETTQPNRAEDENVFQTIFFCEFTSQHES